MGWSVKENYRQQFVGHEGFDGRLYRIEHTDGRFTNKAIFQIDSDSSWAELYQGTRCWGYDPVGLRAWLASAEGIALAMNEVDEMAAITKMSPIYPNIIEVYPSGEPDEYD